MKILMVSSECTPFVKTGGLADVVSSLSSSLAEDGHDVRILLPGYSFLDISDREIIIRKLKLSMGMKDETAGISRKLLPGSKVPVFFLDHPLFSSRKGIYGDNGSHAYRDSHYRFAVLSAASAELIKETGWIPDIVHAHDWQTGPVPAYLEEYRRNGKLPEIKTVFTIHNIGYQGIFSKHDIHWSGLGWEYFGNENPGYNEPLNYMKCGILNSDEVTTVSPTYAEEIKTSEYGHGLDGLLREKADSLKGILNGIDYSEWNPEKDPYLDFGFSAEKPENKMEIKKRLQKDSGLPVEKDIPVIGMVGRLAEQKGFRELLGDDSHEGALQRICRELNVQVVILGTGENWIEEKLQKLEESLPNLKLYLKFDNAVAHLIEAGSDFFLMPSRYEPCGLNQIYSLKYGAVPIVRKTGGLKDTVTDYFSGGNNPTGFWINEMSEDSIFSTTSAAVELFYRNPDILTEIRKNGMEKEYSWSSIAGKYIEMYRSLSG